MRNKTFTLLSFNILYLKYTIYIIIFFSLSCKKSDTSIPSEIKKNTQEEIYSYIIINVSDIKNLNGKINIALYNNEANFNNPDKVFKKYF